MITAQSMAIDDRLVRRTQAFLRALTHVPNLAGRVPFNAEARRLMEELGGTPDVFKRHGLDRPHALDRVMVRFHPDAKWLSEWHMATFGPEGANQVTRLAMDPGFKTAGECQLSHPVMNLSLGHGALKKLNHSVGRARYNWPESLLTVAIVFHTRLQCIACLLVWQKHV